MSIITISSIFNNDYDDYIDFCNNTVVADFIDTTSFETTLTTYVYNPIWLRYKDTPIKFSNDEKGQDAFLRNFYNQLSEVVFDFHNYAKENIEYFLYQNDVTKQGKPMSKTITSGIAPINQTIDQEVDSTNLASGTGSQFVSETVYNGVAWHKLVEGYFTPNRKTALLKAFQWLFVSVYSPETRYDDKIEEKRYVQLSFVDEDNNIIDEQKVLPSKSYYTMSEVNIQRPLMLDPQNVKKDVDIAGIVGTYEPNIYPRIYDLLRLDNPDGVIIYNTPSGYDGLEGVTITIPNTALPENIKQGVNIGGIIGTYYSPDYLQYRINGDGVVNSYTYNNDNITKLTPSAFANDKNVEHITLNNVVDPKPSTETNCDNLFYKCTNLKTATFSNLETLNYVSYMFNGCTNLTTLNMPKLKTISNTGYLCTDCTSLLKIEAPLLETYVGNDGGWGNKFRNCTSLKTVDFGNATGNLGGHDFAGCTSLETVNAPNLSIGLYSAVFFGCTSLKNYTFSQRGIYSNCFSGCTNLEYVIATYTGTSGFTIQAKAFNNCTSLTDITLNKTNGVCTLSNVNAFNGITAPVTIHVPSSLISSYQTASNWSTLYNNGDVTFVAI